MLTIDYDKKIVMCPQRKYLLHKNLYYKRQNLFNRNVTIHIP